MKNREIKNKSLSEQIVSYLRRQGRTLKEIAEMLDLSESFISRVARGERRLTTDQLVILERALRTPLPLLLMQVTTCDTSENDADTSKDDVVGLLEKSSQLRQILRSELDEDDYDDVIITPTDAMIGDSLVIDAQTSRDSTLVLLQRIRAFLEFCISSSRHDTGHDVREAASRIMANFVESSFGDKYTISYRSPFIESDGELVFVYRDILAPLICRPLPGAKLERFLYRCAQVELRRIRDPKGRDANGSAA